MNGESRTRVLAGNVAMMIVSGVTIPDSVKADAASYLGRGASIIYVAVNHVLEGFVALADRVRSESRDVVDDLHSLNVTPVSWYNGSTHCKTTQYEPCYSRLFARR